MNRCTRPLARNEFCRWCCCYWLAVYIPNKNHLLQVELYFSLQNIMVFTPHYEHDHGHEPTTEFANLLGKWNGNTRHTTSHVRTRIVGAYVTPITLNVWPCDWLMGIAYASVTGNCRRLKRIGGGGCAALFAIRSLRAQKSLCPDLTKHRSEGLAVRTGRSPTVFHYILPGPHPNCEGE